MSRNSKGKYLSKAAKGGMSVGALVLILVAVLSLTIGGVVAYLSTSTGAVINTFEADESTDPAVVETFADDKKTDVKVDVGDPGYAVYVRAAVVVTWKAENGDVLGVAPVAGTDYTIDYNEDKWFQGSDGFWYHKAMVNSDKATETLIDSCTPFDGKTPEGYGLNVEIIAQTIQALGTTDESDDGDDTNDNIPAVEDAWKVVIVENGLLKPKT